MTNWQILHKVEHRSWCRRIEDIDSSGRFDNISMAVERTSIAKKIEDILGNDTINTDVLRYIPFCSEYITRFSVQKRQLKIFFDFCDQVAGKMRKSSKIEVFLFCWFLLSSGRSSSKTKSKSAHFWFLVFASQVGRPDDKTRSVKIKTVEKYWTKRI